MIDIYKEQVHVLKKRRGADLLVVKYDEPAGIQSALLAAKEISPWLRLAVMVTMTFEGDEANLAWSF